VSASRPTSVSRRNLLAGLATIPTIFAAAGSSASQKAPVDSTAQEAQAVLNHARETKLVILGSGGGPSPAIPGRTRHNTAHVMVSNGSAYVLDCGLGVTNQFARTGVPFTMIRSIFLTHHHPDHNIEYGPFLLIGWVQGLSHSVRAFGPPPLKQMTEDFKMKPLALPDVKEVSAPGPLLQDENVKVTAAVVQHPPVRPALAYRFDFRDRSIVFSGDTAPLQSVARLASGAEILVHEAMYVPAVEAYVRDRIAKGVPTTFDAYMAHMKADHSPVEDVGRIAQEGGVKTLVLSHLVPAIDGIPNETWRDAAAKHFKGDIVVARDLMVI
jgi:ribonuclease BN (tRNA processing enzyme)